jgi:hypothetical protein
MLSTLAADVVTEAANEGTDTVQSIVTGRSAPSLEESHAHGQSCNQWHRQRAREYLDRQQRQ